MTNWFNVHTHTRYSYLDGMSGVGTLFDKADKYGYPALGLMDHGNMSATVQAYRASQRTGVLFYPGIETYLIDPMYDGTLEDSGKAGRFHLGIQALDLKGYQALVRFTSKTHTRPRFNRFPRCTLADLSELGEEAGEHLAIYTGCFFGYVQQTLLREGETKAARIVKMLATWFPHTFVELQHHNIIHEPEEGADIFNTMNDDEMVNGLVSIADRLGLPFIATQDNHYCNTPEAPVWMADMSFREIGDIQVGDKVMGWTKSEDNRYRNFVESTVVDRSIRRARVVRITMKSGRVIRCTPDHKWATGKAWRFSYYRGTAHEYAPAIVGESLVKVIEPTEPVLSFQQHDAGWLGGMYDGEGNKAAIAQSPTHNPETCTRIEETLTALGFEYSVKSNGAGCNLYNLLGGKQAYVDFVNICKPTRATHFRKKVLDWARGELDEVISIEDDGWSDVISLTTETGNYTAWGYASKNCDQREKKAHALMKRMVYGGVDNEFPGDSFHLASDEWVAEHYDSDIWDGVLEGCEHLLDLHKLKIPPLDNFKVHVPQVSDTPDKELRRLCADALDDYLDRMGLEDQREVYEARDVEERRVIKKLGMGNYFLHVLSFVTWTKRKGFAIEARGSANGSLTCFLLGITQTDPIIWDGRFERFLSEDRIKAPDIDIDIEHVARPEAIRFLNKNHESVQIGNMSELGAREADQRGSVMATYIQYLRRTCIEAEKNRERRRAERKDEKPRIGEAEKRGVALFNRDYGWVKSLDDVRELNEKDWAGLVELASMANANGSGVLKSYGVHASGILVSGEDMSFKDYIPTMLVASSNTTVTQYDMDDVEEFGFLKDDLLGQKTLTIMRLCQEMIGREDPTDFTWIPENDPVALKALREGRTDTGIFHFEGYSKAKGGRELGVKSMKDAIMVQALYMPGAMESGQKDLYVQRHKSAKARQQITYLHPVFENALKSTYGTVIFQEQPLDILRGIGMSMTSINKMFKVIKDSGKGAVERNRERLKELRKEFNEHALAADFDEADLDEAWRLTTGFMNYGFNRAHASGYGIRSYRCAYLKMHHTIEFMTALLQVWAGVQPPKKGMEPKEVLYIREARRMKIKVLQPHVNVSSATWTLDREANAIRRGLVSIKGVGDAAAESLAANAPYTSIDDIVAKCPSKQVTGGKEWLANGRLIGTLRQLEDVGALDGLSHKRTPKPVRKMSRR